MEKEFVANSNAGQQCVILENRIDEIRRLSIIVEEFFGEHQLPSEMLFKINLVFEEIISNIIYYGYEDDTKHEIVINMNLLNGILAVEIKDDGKAFNPLANPEPRLDAPLEERPIGGMGIYLVKHLVDEIRYNRYNNFNILSFRKNIRDKG